MSQALRLNLRSRSVGRWGVARVWTSSNPSRPTRLFPVGQSPLRGAARRQSLQSKERAESLLSSEIRALCCPQSCLTGSFCEVVTSIMEEDQNHFKTNFIHPQLETETESFSSLSNCSSVPHRKIFLSAEMMSSDTRAPTPEHTTSGHPLLAGCRTTHKPLPPHQQMGQIQNSHSGTCLGHFRFCLWSLGTVAHMICCSSVPGPRLAAGQSPIQCFQDSASRNH